jgi:DNA repair protein RecN (Recombination protein N)
VLSELHIENFAVIADARLKLEPGLTILSGEEGAGKSLVADALEALMGAKMGSGVVRTGAASAHVEGTFQLDAGTRERISELFAETEISPDEDGTLILSREIQENGRSPARINRRAVPLALLKQFGTALLDLHSQLDYLSLLDAARQRDLVDRFGKLTELKQGVSAGVDRLREMKREIKAAHDRPIESSGDFLSHQLNEIDDAEISVGEDETLQRERETLRQADTIKEGCHLAYANLYGDDGAAASRLHQALAALREAARADDALEPQVARLETLAAETEDSAREVLRHGEELAADSARLEDIEQRLHLIASLKRKYGATITDVLEAGEKLRAELEQLTDRESYLNGLAAKVAALETEVGGDAAKLSEARGVQAAALSELVNRELADVGLPDVTFGVTVSREAAEDGLPPGDGGRYVYTRDGIDRIVFTVATNPGEPMRPLAEIASGGETSRIVLAVKSALKRADPVPTLVFDEIDMGVGARSGDGVGRKLSDLAVYHQVICITHLPQIACFADTHYRLVKETASGRAVTTVDRVEGAARVAELAAMLGAASAGEVMTQGAGELVTQAAAWKAKNGKELKQGRSGDAGQGALL